MGAIGRRHRAARGGEKSIRGAINVARDEDRSRRCPPATLPITVPAIAFAFGIALWTVPASAQNGPYELPDDAFFLYKAKADKQLGQTLPKGVSVDLADQFQTDEHAIRKVRNLGNPADLNSEGIVDPNTHLSGWRIRANGAKHVRQNIETIDRFGRLSLETSRTDRVLVPAAKSLTAPPPWIVSPPNGADHDVDHYQCYQVKIASRTDRFPKGLTVTMVDQFAEPLRTFSVRKPKVFCNPVNVDGGGIKNPDGHLVCYQVRSAAGEPRLVITGPVQVADRFVAEAALSKLKEDLLCVPALKNPPAEFCGDGVVNQAGEECDGDDSVCPGQTDVCLSDCTCVPARRRCGDGVLDPGVGEQCEVDGDCSAGESCTSSCTCMDSQCPDTLEWSRAGLQSDYDSGFTGIAHNNAMLDSTLWKIRISAVSGSGPSSCGAATIAGIDPSSGSCRCADDHRQLCDQPLEVDLDDCGGSVCTCYLDPPSPALSGGVGTCNVAPFSADITGTWNLDTGEGEIIAPSEQTARLELNTLDPCPLCNGDVTPHDGIRDGVCSGGLNDGQDCDAQALDVAFAGNGAFSLDCLSAGPQVASKLYVNHVLTTGSINHEAALPCDFEGSDLCHCGRCDGDESVACADNADCSTVGGPCDVVSETIPRANACSDGVCTDLGDGQGECQGGAENDQFEYCDGILLATGEGLLPCNNNSDCTAREAGNCTIVELRTCIPDTIAMTGTPSTTEPFVVSAACTSPSSANPAANTVSGYPARGVRREQLETVFRCAGNPAETYPNCSP
jgi:hypothetical protein